ncbi:MAG TPA: hypothetical protein VK964_04395 [Nocardioidaceae bacterium]|nr:hypothetical protein [Nocardioidaceae bacterium]
MNEAWMLTFAAFVPFLALGLVLWLARLEDTLGDGIESPKATKATREAAAAVATATTAPASPDKAPATAAA